MLALALEVLILSTPRTSEITGTTWEEIDFDSQVWTIPAERIKADKEHIIPLTSRAFKVIDQLSEVKIRG